MWNTSCGIRTLQGPEAMLFRKMVAFMLDQIREELRDLGREEPIFAEVAVFDTLTLAQQVAALAEVVPALLDQDIPRLPSRPSTTPRSTPCSCTTASFSRP